MPNSLIANARTRLGLLGGLIHGERAFVGPAYLTFDMTTRCNCICRGCMYHCSEQRRTSLEEHVSEELPLEVVQRVAPELKRMGTHEVMLSGEGEPLLHSRFYEIVAAFRQAGLRVRSFTNGMLLDEGAAGRIVHSGLEELCPTYWAVNREEHLAWHPGINPEFLERRKRGLQLLRQAKAEAGGKLPRVNLQFPLNRTNYRNLGERVQLALESGCDRISFGVFRDYGGPFEGECLVPLDRERILDDMLEAGVRLERADIAHNIRGYLDRLGRGKDAWRDYPCYIGFFEAYVKLDGSVFACCRCRLSMGNLRERSFEEIWNSPPYRDFRRRALDPDELARMGEDCDCANCCYWHDNRRVHAIWRRVAPFVPRARKAVAK